MRTIFLREEYNNIPSFDPNIIGNKEVVKFGEEDNTKIEPLNYTKSDNSLLEFIDPVDGGFAPDSINDKSAAIATISTIGGDASYEIKAPNFKAKLYENNRKNIEKDEVIKKLIPDTISECALHLGRKEGEVCSSPEMVIAIGNSLGIKGSPGQIMESAKAELNCNSEKCVLEKSRDKIGSEAIKREINAVIKIEGPTNNKLLNNYNIDRTLRQWTAKFGEFFPYNFNMLNYAKYSFRNGEVIDEPDSLATVNWADLYCGEFGRRYTTSGCVINSDTYQGQGKHWMALFVDTRGPRWSVEFFNSSGNSPSGEWLNWMLKTRDQLELAAEKSKKNNITIDVVKVCNIRQQQSKSECGVYSLFYIWARLNGIPHEYFNKSIVPDQIMFEFRQHLFAGEENRKTFDFEDYAKRVRIEWE